MSSHNNVTDSRCMVAFIFDSGKFNTYSYGDAAMKAILRGKELQRNQYRIIVSVGDVIKQGVFSDISPYVIFDELCSINWQPIVQSEKDVVMRAGIKDWPYAILMEDIEKAIIKKIDIRLHDECEAYIGVTSVDDKSVDQRKQFWKSLIRLFSLEGRICTLFGEAEDCFVYKCLVEEAGYEIHYDGFQRDLHTGNGVELFSTRQSSFIYKIKHLETVEGHNDSDRGIIPMNFALVKEVEIAGIEIWKAIEDINRVYLIKNCREIIVDYVFTSFYQAAQGIERLLKIMVELVVYSNKNDNKDKTDKLLYSHNHVALADYLAKKGIVTFDTTCRKLLQLLETFYNKARYNRYLDGHDDKMELDLLNCFGNNLREENYNEEFKKMYGKILGKVSRISYKTIHELSSKLGIFVHELNFSSVATIVFWDYYQENLYKSLLQLEKAKKELLWYLIFNGERIRKAICEIEFSPLSFDGPDIKAYILAMIRDDLAETEILAHIEEEYSELFLGDKEKAKQRQEYLNYLFSAYGVENSQ